MTTKRLNGDKRAAAADTRSTRASGGNSLSKELAASQINALVAGEMLWIRTRGSASGEKKTFTLDWIFRFSLQDIGRACVKRGTESNLKGIRFFTKKNELRDWTLVKLDMQRMSQKHSYATIFFPAGVISLTFPADSRILFSRVRPSALTMFPFNSKL